MCGIFGVVFRDPARVVTPQVFAPAVNTLQHRGPDDMGLWGAPGVVLGSRRLAILDVSPSGHMPMATADGRHVIVYNGEVYNFAELRRDLQSKGHVFRSRTDTEVLLRLFVEDGPAMLPKLNGMFAFAIWDTHERTLFAARDRVGVKPLCYAVESHAVTFASEHKALFAAGVRQAFDHDKWHELLCFRYVAGEDTPYSGVRRLLPGHYLIAKNGEVQTRPWWKLSHAARERRESLPPDPVAWYRHQFAEATSLRLISDVPVGVLLSGGLDSSTVAAAAAAEGGCGISSYTMRFREPEFDEGNYAKLVAVRWALDYHELFVPPEDLLSLLQRAAWLNDEPLAHGSDQHLLAIAAFAKPTSTVLLSGEGADETLGGYVRYQPLRFASAVNAARPLLPLIGRLTANSQRTRKLARFMSLRGMDDFVFFNSCDVLPSDLDAVGLQPDVEYPFRRAIHDEARQLYPGDYMRQAMFADQHTFLCSLLDRNDRMTMGGSIECRVPFLDYRLVETLAALPTEQLVYGRKTKPLLRQAFGSSLPTAVMRHRKWGFGVPWAKYFRASPVFRERIAALARQPVISNSPLDSAKVDRLAARYLKGDDSLLHLVRELFMLSVWADASFSVPTTPLADRAAPIFVGQ
jgi:asparagine synthase (glutamine-hydrolysing)